MEFGTGAIYFFCMGAEIDTDMDIDVDVDIDRYWEHLISYKPAEPRDFKGSFKGEIGP